MIHLETAIFQVKSFRLLLWDMVFSVQAQISGNYELIIGLSNVHEAGFNYLSAEDMQVVYAEIDRFIYFNRIIPKNGLKLM